LTVLKTPHLCGRFHYLTSRRASGPFQGNPSLPASSRVDGVLGFHQVLPRSTSRIRFTGFFVFSLFYILGPSVWLDILKVPLTAARGPSSSSRNFHLFASPSPGAGFGRRNLSASFAQDKSLGGSSLPKRCRREPTPQHTM